MNSSESGEQIEKTTSAGEKEHAKGAGHHGGKCTNISLYLSIAALVLAGYAAIAASSGPKTDTQAALKATVSNLEIQVQNLSTRLSSLGDDLMSNRENMVQNQLKKALYTIQEIGDSAKGDTKAAIAEVEAKLQALTGGETKQPAEQAAPNEPATPAEQQPAAEPATTPAATTAAPGATTPASSEAPADSKPASTAEPAPAAQ